MPRYLLPMAKPPRVTSAEVERKAAKLAGRKLGELTSASGAAGKDLDSRRST